MLYQVISVCGDSSVVRLSDSIFPGKMVCCSELYSTAAVFSGTLLLTYAFLRFSRRKKQTENLPPSLPSVPFLGSLPFMPQRDRMHIFFMEKARELGPVFSFNFPNRMVVVINGREMIQEAYVKQSLAFASKAFNFTNDLLNPGRKGILIHPYDSAFRKYHQLSLNILKKFGFGKGILENRIHVEVEDLLESIRKLNGKAFCADQILTRSVSNVIVSMMFGERYDLSSSVLDKLIKNTHEFIFFSRHRLILDFLPLMRFLPTYRRSLNHLVKVHGEINSHMSSKIDAGVKGDLPESFVTHFLEMEGPGFDRDQLMFTLRDLLLAGTETSATTLQWALIYLANHPDIRERLRTEIDSVVSMDRLPALDDRKKLPFTEAVILELMRIKTIVPLGLPHEMLNEAWLNGHFIPKNTMVLANLYSAHLDPIVWPEPDTFNPQRFLDVDGNVTNRDAIIPFSLGRRSCLGETLAQQELFLFLTGLVQQFDILPPDGQSTVAYKESVSITLMPVDYEVRLLPRCE